MKLWLSAAGGIALLLLLASSLLAATRKPAISSLPGSPPPSTLREDLFVKVDPAEDLLLEWRWKVGEDAKVFRVTVFGDLFTQTSGGQIYWLDTGSGSYVEVAKSAEQWAEAVKVHEAEWFHEKTLQDLHSRGAKLKAGDVYSWRQEPMLGGVESADNVDLVSLQVHVSYSGRVAKAVKDIPPGTKIDKVEFEPLPGGGAPDTTIYNVVINSELQYSIWPAGQEIPADWKRVGKTGTKDECLQYIKKVWTDMRPLSLRKKTDGQ